MNQDEAFRKICQVWSRYYAGQAHAAQRRAYFWLAVMIIAAIFVIVVALWPMPMPAPYTGETRSDFVSRFMGSALMQKEFPGQKQRLAVAYSQWRKFKARKRKKKG